MSDTTPENAAEDDGESKPVDPTERYRSEVLALVKNAPLEKLKAMKEAYDGPKSDIERESERMKARDDSSNKFRKRLDEMRDKLIPSMRSTQ